MNSKNTLLILFASVFLLQACSCQFMINDQLNGKMFESLVASFCHGKETTNFCSSAHVQLMLIIHERARVDALEMELKRMEKQIARNIFRMNSSD
jgi:hypothetical protein